MPAIGYNQVRVNLVAAGRPPEVRAFFSCGNKLFRLEGKSLFGEGSFPTKSVQ